MELLKAPTTRIRGPVAHANAAVAPRHRLKLGRAVVDDGRKISYATAVLDVA